MDDQILQSEIAKMAHQSRAQQQIMQLRVQIAAQVLASCTAVAYEDALTQSREMHDPAIGVDGSNFQINLQTPLELAVATSNELLETMGIVSPQQPPREQPGT